MAIETERRVFLSCERLSVHLSLQIIFERFNYTSVTAANTETASLGISVYVLWIFFLRK